MTKRTRDLRATPMRRESLSDYTVQRKTPPRNIVLHISDMEPDEAFEVAIAFLGKRPGTITINARPE